MKGPVFTSRLASLSSSNLFLRRQLWVWPLIAAALLTAVALFARSSIESALRQSLTDQLEAVLKTDVTALEFWLSEQKAIVSGIARDPEVVKLVGILVADAQGLPADQIREQLPGPITAMRTEMKGYVESHGYLGFMVIDLDKRIIASSYDELIGLKMAPELRCVLQQGPGRRRRRHAAVQKHDPAARRPRRDADGCGDHGRRGAGSRLRRQDSGRVGIAHPAGSRFHPHPGDGPHRQQRRNLCLRRPGGVVVGEPVR